MNSWRQAFRALVTHADFLEHAWAKCPFKLDQEWDFAIGWYTMADVEADVTLLPPQFVAHGMRWGDGIYNKPMDSGFSFKDVSRTMSGATVVMLNAGFIVPSLAQISLAMLEATSMPIWLNVYLTRPGLSSSTQLHTDKQDVLLVQTTGHKRWRVYTPPPPANQPQLDPFARGKGTDQMDPSGLELLIDTVMGPGQVLYVPAGFPHETDTAGDAELGEEPSVHLTIGIDTHLWGLSWAQARDVALRRGGGSAALVGGASVNSLTPDRWHLLHSPLPVGFASAPHLSVPSSEQASAPALATARAAAAEKALCAAIGEELCRRMCEAEPLRWASDAELHAELPVSETAERMLAHHRAVLREQTRMYVRTAYSSPRSARERAAAQAALFDDMDALDKHMASLEAWAEGSNAPPTRARADGQADAPAPRAGGFGGSRAPSKKAKGGKKAKARAR